MPGDEVYVPDLRSSIINAQSDTRTKFRRKGVPSKFRIVVQENDKPIANKPYILIIDGRKFEGTTGNDGAVEQAISPTAKSGNLIINVSSTREKKIELQLGGLDPVEEIAGVKQRLANLGYLLEPQGNQLDSDTEHAIKVFQAEHNLECSGEPDKATQDKLLSIHGC